MLDLTPDTLIVSAEGGKITFVSLDGELLLAVAVPAGSVRWSRFMRLLPPDSEPIFSDGLALIPPMVDGSVGRKSFLTGANSEYAPSSADRMQRRMEHQIRLLQAQTDAQGKRLRALARMEAMPKPSEPAAAPPAGIEPAAGDAVKP